MDKSYWEKYYREHKRPAVPSRFAAFVLKEHLRPEMRLIELGCGNGRDSVFFAHNGVSVCAVDQVEKEIQFLNDKCAHKNLKFVVGDFTRLSPCDTFDCVYSRFTLHSVSEEDELRVLRWVRNALGEGGLFCIEVRSTNDPKMQAGERISESENIVDGHYRRYIDLAVFSKKLEGLGFEVTYAEESTEFAPYKDEAPPVIRIVAVRNADGDRA